MKEKKEESFHELTEFVEKNPIRETIITTADAPAIASQIKKAQKLLKIEKSLFYITSVSLI